MRNLKINKKIIDDGFCSYLVKGAEYNGFLDMPVIRRPCNLVIPNGAIPFSQRYKSKYFDEFIVFYEHDKNFVNIVQEIPTLLESLRKHIGIVTPDNSLYWDMPLVLQMANVYINRAVGVYLQNNGCYVIPNIRWGDERTYTRILKDELPFAFMGLEKNGTYCISTYGCLQNKEKRKHMRAGLLAMLEELEPEVVFVYGSFPVYLLDDIKVNTKFILLTDWIKEKRGYSHE